MAAFEAAALFFAFSFSAAAFLFASCFSFSAFSLAAYRLFSLRVPFVPIFTRLLGRLAGVGFVVCTISTSLPLGFGSLPPPMLRLFICGDGTPVAAVFAFVDLRLNTVLGDCGGAAFVFALVGFVGSVASGATSIGCAPDADLSVSNVVSFAPASGDVCCMS